MNFFNARVPDAVRHPSCCSAEPGPTLADGAMGPGSAAHRKSAALRPGTERVARSEAHFLSSFPHPLIARLPSRLMVNQAEARIASVAFVAWGGVRVAYSV